jgi:hypothetical protein
MNEIECDAAIDATPEISAPEYWKAGRKRIEARRLTGIPFDSAESIVAGLRAKVTADSKPAIARRDLPWIDRLLSKYDSDVLDAVNLARQSGELRPHEPSDEIKKYSGQWGPKCYASFDVATLLKMLLPNERIIAPPGFRSVVTNQREISRDDLRKAAGSAANQLVSEKVIAEAEQAAVRVESRKRQYSAGPSNIIGQPIEN